MATVRTMLAGVLLILVTGCSPWGTYPPIDGAASLHEASMAPYPELMAEALWYAYEQDRPNAPLIFNLPAGTPYTVYDQVTTKLHVECYAMTSPDQPAYHVAEVRVRGTDSQVDVIHRGPDGRPQLMTVYFEQKIDGLRVMSSRRWRIHVDEPYPHYDPPVETEMATTPDDSDVTTGPDDSDVATAESSTTDQ